MANFSSWVEGIVLALAVVSIVVIIFGAMDAQYGGSHSTDISNALGDKSNATANLIQSEGQLLNQSDTGSVSFNALGIALTTSYSMVKLLMNIILSFITGGFIYSVIGALNLGAAGTILATSLVVIWYLGIFLFLLYLLFKVKS